MVTWPLSRKDLHAIYTGINEKTLTKRLDALGIPKGRILFPKEVAKVFEELWLPHENYEVRIAGVKVEVLQMDLGF